MIRSNMVAGNDIHLPKEDADESLGEDADENLSEDGYHSFSEDEKSLDDQFCETIRSRGCLLTWLRGLPRNTHKETTRALKYAIITIDEELHGECECNKFRI